jgi:hypothetical protein
MLTGKFTRTLPWLLSSRAQIYCETIAAYHLPNAVDSIIVMVPINRLYLTPCKDTRVVDCIHKCAIV